MSQRLKRSLIVLAALIAYVPLAYGVVLLVALWNWSFRLRMCDSACGSSPDLPTEIAVHIAQAAFVLALAGGLLWIWRGKPVRRRPEIQLA